MLLPRFFLLAVAVLVASAVHAGASSGGADARRDTCGRGVAFGPATPPFGPASQLQSVAEARDQLSFIPRLPAGRPFRIFVSREQEKRLRRLGLTYRSGPSRWYQLTQGRLFVSDAQFEKSLTVLAARDLCSSRSSTLRLRNGSLALLTEAKDRRLIVFRHGRLELMLLTAPNSGSAMRLRALANALSQS